MSEDARTAMVPLELLASLASLDDCELDINGDCQAHWWFHEGECPDARAKRILAEHGYVPDEVEG